MFNPARPAPFVLVSTDHGMMIVNGKDFEAVEGGVIGVSVELFNHSQYDAAQLELMLEILSFRREQLGDGVVVIDGGANIGSYTLFLARAMTGWGRVLAFEPQEMLYYALCGNIAVNNCFNARAVCAGLGSGCEESLEMPLLDYTKPRNFGGVHLQRKVDGPSQTVTLVAIDSLGFPRVDLIKLDIEGMEIVALEGARKTIERCKPLISAEHIICGMDALKEMLEPLGYAVQMTGMNTLCVHKDDPISKRIRFYDSTKSEAA